MKKLRNIALPLLASLALFACEKDYDAPLLTEPELRDRKRILRLKTCVHRLRLLLIKLL